VSAGPPPYAAPAERKASKLSGWSGEGKEPRRLVVSPSLNHAVHCRFRDITESS